MVQIMMWLGLSMESIIQEALGILLHILILSFVIVMLVGLGSCSCMNLKALVAGMSVSQLCHMVLPFIIDFSTC